jgi:DNA-binding transcriptional regulator YiaG
MAATKISANGRMASGSSRTRSGGGRPRKKAVKAASSLGRTIQVRGVRNRLGVSQEELARITGYSVRAIAGWEAGKKLSGPALQKVAETERLRAALAEIVPPAELGAWMRTPNSAFEGQSPIQVIERGEADRIWRMIIQIDAGVAN